MRPRRVTCTSVDHQERVRPGRLSRGSNDDFVGLCIRASKRTPPNLECAKANTRKFENLFAHALRFIHEQRRVRLDSVAVPTPQKPSHRLSRNLAEDVPERDIYPTDDVGQRAASAEPKRFTMQLFADALGFEGVLTQPVRLEHLDCRPDQIVIGRDAAKARDTLISMNSHERVNHVFGNMLSRPPSTLRGRTLKAGDLDRLDLQGRAATTFVEVHCRDKIRLSPDFVDRLFCELIRAPRSKLGLDVRALNQLACWLTFCMLTRVTSTQSRVKQPLLRIFKSLERRQLPEQRKRSTLIRATSVQPGSVDFYYLGGAIEETRYELCLVDPCGDIGALGPTTTPYRLPYRCFNP